MRSLIAVCILFATAGHVYADQLFIATNFFSTPNTLYTVDTTDPTNPTLVGGIGGSKASFGLADFNGRLFSFNQSNDTIIEINPNTGALLNATDLGANEVGEGAIAFRSDGKGFLFSSQGGTGMLRSFDIGVVGNVLVDNNLNPSMDGADFQPGTDVLFGLSQTSGDLYTVDQTNGDTTLIGSAGIGGGLAGLTFGPSGLFGISGAGLLYSINPNNGNAVLLGDTGLDDVSGLSALNGTGTQPVPEPASIATWSLLGLMGVGYGWRRKRRQGAKSDTHAIA